MIKYYNTYSNTIVTRKHVRAMVSQRRAKLCMMSGQSSSPVMHDACEDLGQNYLKADIIQSLALENYGMMKCRQTSEVIIMLQVTIAWHRGLLA